MGEVSLPPFVFGPEGGAFEETEEERRRRKLEEAVRALVPDLPAPPTDSPYTAARVPPPLPHPAATSVPPPQTSPPGPPRPVSPAAPPPAQNWPPPGYRYPRRAGPQHGMPSMSPEEFFGDTARPTPRPPGGGAAVPPQAAPTVSREAVDSILKSGANQIGMSPDRAAEHQAGVASERAGRRMRIAGAIAALLGVPVETVNRMRQEAEERPYARLREQRANQAATEERTARGQERAAQAAEQQRRADLQDAAERRAVEDQGFQRTERERIAANRDRERMETEELGQEGSQQSYAAQEDLRLRYPAIPDAIVRRFSAFDLRDEATQRRLDELYGAPSNPRERREQARARAEFEAGILGGAPAPRQGGGGQRPAAEPTPGETEEAGLEERVVQSAIEQGATERAAREAYAVLNNRRATPEARRLARTTLGIQTSGEAGLEYRRELQERGQEILPGINAEVEVTPTEIAALRNTAQAAVEGVRNLNALEEIANDYGGVEARIDREAAARLTAVRQPLMAMVSNIRQSGVIQPGEVEVIESAIPNPEDFIGRPFGSFQAAMREWRALVARRVGAAFEGRGVSREAAQRAVQAVERGEMPRGPQRREGGGQREAGREGQPARVRVRLPDGRVGVIPTENLEAATRRGAVYLGDVR